MLEKAYRKYESEWPFQYTFADDDFNKSFQDDIRMAQMTKIFTVIAIFLACMGLYALITFTTQSRIKEIGIRKVLGADVPGLARLLSADFVKLVIAAVVISLPVAWYAVDQWLQNFVYRVDVSWWIYVLTGVIALVLAVVTVGLQSARAASMNPVDTLKTE